MSIWEHTNKQIKCPMCRKEICLIFSDFYSDEDCGTLVQRIKSYNRLFHDDRSLWVKLVELPFILSRWIFSLNNIINLIRNIHAIFIMFLAISYVIMPIDLIPEVIFGFFGLIDDVIVMCTLSLLVSNLYIQQEYTSYSSR